MEQQTAGPDPERDAGNVNPDILEIRRRIPGGGLDAREGIDAAAVWEPNVSHFGPAGLARSMSDTHTPGVVAMSDEFIAGHAEAAVQFPVAPARARDYFPRNPERVMPWFRSHLPRLYTFALIMLLASTRPHSRRPDPRIPATRDRPDTRA